MSTAQEKDEGVHDIQEQQQQQEKQNQDTEMDKIYQEKENSAPVMTKEQETPKEENVVTAEQEKVKAQIKSITKKTPSQEVKIAPKRKFDALEARHSAAKPSSHEHQKTKKDCATKVMKKLATKSQNRGSSKPEVFSFARPTESSARRTAALTENQTKSVKATPPPSKPHQVKRTSAKAQGASTMVLKTPTDTGAADKAPRPHFSYTPYTGPLPPLTVESSFAPKNGQISDCRAWSASPALTKAASAARKPRPASAKKTQLQSTTGCEHEASSSETPVKSTACE